MTERANICIVENPIWSSFIVCFTIMIRKHCLLIPIPFFIEILRFYLEMVLKPKLASIQCCRYLDTTNTEVMVVPRISIGQSLLKTYTNHLGLIYSQTHLDQKLSTGTSYSQAQASEKWASGKKPPTMPSSSNTSDMVWWHGRGVL